MTPHNLRILALIFAIQARIEGMKAANSQYPENQPHSASAFNELAEEIERLANSFT